MDDDDFFIFPIVLAVVSFTLFCGCCCLCLCFAKKQRRRFPTVNRRSRTINASTNTEDTVHGYTHFPAIYTAGNDIGPPSYYEATAPSMDDCYNNSNHHGVHDSSGGGTCDTSGGNDSGGGTCDSGGGNDSGGGTCDSGGGNDSGGGTCDSGGGGCDSGGTD